MYLITKQYHNVNSIPEFEIINILFNKESDFAVNWVKEYLINDIISLKYKPLDKNIKNIEYYFTSTDSNSFHLKKKCKTLRKGYVYNSYEITEELVYTVKILKNDTKYEESVNYNNDTTLLWKNINIEINKRAIKKLNKCSLIEFVLSMNNEIYKKENFSKTDIILLQKTLLQNLHIQKRKVD